jgi:predicted nucleic acid-binding protein
MYLLDTDILSRYSLGDANVRIAAIALSHGLKVVTGNERHFRRVSELEIGNWLEQ